MGLGDRFKKMFNSKKDGNGHDSPNEDFSRETADFNGNSFTSLDRLIHSGVGEIVLDCDIVLDDREESKYKFGIRVDVDGLVIDGAGHTIDACGKTMIFLCMAQNVTIRNIVLKNGFCLDHSMGMTPDGRIFSGGAVCNIDGDLTVEEVMFVQNNSQNYAGALYNSDGELKVSNSTFTKNYSKSSGGALANMRGEATVVDCSFEDNSSMDGGGGIFNSDRMTVRRCEFKGNSSVAIYANGSAISNVAAKLDISKSLFLQNSSKGSTLYNHGELTISESKINENTSTQDEGIIFNFKGMLKMFDCAIMANKSRVIALNKDAMQTYKCYFRRNSSEHIVSNVEEDASLGIFGGKFTENRVEKSVICNSGKFTSVERAVFANNYSLDMINCSEMILIHPKLMDEGKTILNNGFIDLKDSPIELMDKIFGDGEVAGGGGGFFGPPILKGFGHLDALIHESDTKEIVLDEDICFQDYERDFYEGGVELDIDDLVIDGNGMTIDAADRSRIFTITGRNVTLKNIIFKNGRSHRNYDAPFNSRGGAVKVIGSGDLKILGCTFSGNASEDSGGAVYNRGKLMISESGFDENGAKVDGGAIDNSGKLAMKECAVKNNEAREHGGAISSSGELKVVWSDFNRNTSQTAGAIYGHGSKSYMGISDSLFANNSAGLGGVGSGGAIYVNEGKLEAGQSKFIENAAEDFGGAICNYGWAAIFESILAENDGFNGGGAIDNRGEMFISRSRLKANTSSTQKIGGAIWNHECVLEISECELDGNVAEDNGSAIYNYGELEIRDSNITNNVSGRDSAAIENTDRNLFKSINCKFENNVPRDIKN